MVDLTKATFEGILHQMSEERKAKASNMKLGDFIDALAAVADQTLPLVLRNGDGVHRFMSYRGYYEDLWISPRADKKTVAEVLAQARAALGEIFEGYKGGDYPMHKGSILWVAGYGNCGDMLTGVTLEPGRVVVETAPDNG